MQLCLVIHVCVSWMWCKIEFSLWFVVWKVGKVLPWGSPAGSMFLAHLLFQPDPLLPSFWRSLWFCASLWDSTFQTLLPSRSWLRCRILILVHVHCSCSLLVPAHPSPCHPPHVWGCGLKLQLGQNTDALVVHGGPNQEPTRHTGPSAFALQLLSS